MATAATATGWENLNIPLRASRPKAEGGNGGQAQNISRGTNSQQSARTTATTTPYLTGANATGNRFFKRVTGRLNPWVYQPRTGTAMGQMHASRINWKWLFALASKIMTILLVLYTIVFLIVLGYISAYNTLNYGPTHTAYTTAVLNGTTSTIQTSNQGGTIYVMITKQDGSSQTYTGPNLNLTADSWNRDVNSVVATAEVHPGQNTITIHLLGNINYFRPFFVRPEAKFLLVPDQQAGYKVVQP